MESAVELLEKMAKVVRDGKIKETPHFGCNNGPNLRMLLDSANIYEWDQRVYSIFQTFDTEGHELALKVLGLLPINLTGREQKKSDYLLLAKVILPNGENAITVRNGEIVLHHEDILVGTYNPHRRYGSFYLFESGRKDSAKLPITVEESAA